MKTWKISDLSKAIPQPFRPGTTPVIFADNQEMFDIVVTPDRIVFGGGCNAGFLESGYIEREEFETLDVTLQELHEELNCFYRDGREYCNRIVTNERM